MGDLYSKVEEEAGLCYKVADSAGLGFTVPAEKKIETCDVAPIALKVAFVLPAKRTGTC
jgi:hypothetical protein